MGDAEVHRTQTSYNDSLIIKGFCFEFVNRYFLLFYIAFFKSGEFMGTPDTCDVVNEAVVVDGIEGDVPVPDCINDLATQLKVVFVFKTIIQQIKEIYYPDIKRCYRRWRETRGIENPEESDELDELDDDALSPRTRRRRGGLSYVEEQNIMDSYGHPFPATYDDFQEMTIQFGFMTLFAVAYPIGALFALVNNIIEIPVDGQKLTTDCRRPRYRNAEDIGSWMTVLQCITVCAVITNSLLVSFSSTTLVQDLDLFGSICSRYSQADLWLTVLVMEHSLLLVKFMLSVFVPDVSSTTEAKKAELQFFLKSAEFQRTASYGTPRSLSVCLSVSLSV